MRGGVELGTSAFQFGATRKQAYVNFLQLGAKIGNHAEVVVEWSDKFGMSGAKLSGAWQDHIHICNHQGELPNGFDGEIGLASEGAPGFLQQVE